MHTFTSALALIGVEVPDHLQAEAEVPVLQVPQAQGDLLIFPAEPPARVRWEALPATGVQVINGEATGNTHWLHPGFDSPGIRWARIENKLTLGYLEVPAEQSALLIHTDEHGANGIGPGIYALNRKRELRLETLAPRQRSREWTTPAGVRMSLTLSQYVVD
jgi:hypothetical protein